MYLRTYGYTDCQDIVTLFKETVYKINSQDYTKEQCDAWTKSGDDLKRWQRILQNHYCVVVVEKGMIIGFGDIDESGYLDHLYVHYAFQRQKVATLICDHLERRAAVITTHASITARPFFEKRGYHVVKEQQVILAGQRLTNYVMMKRKDEMG